MKDFKKCMNEGMNYMQIYEELMQAIYEWMNEKKRDVQWVSVKDVWVRRCLSKFITDAFWMQYKIGI